MLPENKKIDGQEDKSNQQKASDAELIQQGAQGNGENLTAAHDQAEEDIEHDPDFNLPTPNDDLDEGETALLGDDKIDLI